MNGLKTLIKDIILHCFFYARYAFSYHYLEGILEEKVYRYLQRHGFSLSNSLENLPVFPERRPSKPVTI
ncbi:MAG TPA: hypothetical protein VIF10_09840 [Methylobacter sp.]|jgi:hypothetical protein